MSDERAIGKVPPYVITTRDMVRTTAERWKYLFKHHPQGSEHHLIGLKLEALDRETASIEDVKAIVGEDWFARLECSQCGQETDAVVVVGQVRDWESCTAELCVSCALSAAKLVSDLMSGNNAPENKPNKHVPKERKLGCRC